MWESWGEGPFEVAKHLAEGIDDWHEVSEEDPWGPVSSRRKAEMFVLLATMFAAKAAEWQAQAICDEKLVKRP